MSFKEQFPSLKKKEVGMILFFGNTGYIKDKKGEGWCSEDLPKMYEWFTIVRYCLDKIKVQAGIKKMFTNTEGKRIKGGVWFTQEEIEKRIGLK